MGLNQHSCGGCHHPAVARPEEDHMTETAFICETCGTQHTPSEQPPDSCPICVDERQYVGPDGQCWTTLGELRAGHRADIREEDRGLTGIGARPAFGIGQRALLVQTPAGNVLWDCTALLDDEITEAVRQRGGVAAIAISHPHFYTSMVEWSRAFDAPIHLHRADRAWVMRPDEAIRFWDGEQHELVPGITLLRLGGHFAGGTVLHWAQGADGAGTLLSGDIIQVVPDRGWVSFMRSYPNLIPLPAATVGEIVAALAPWPFERLYGGWFGRVVDAEAGAAVRRSADRYRRALTAGFAD
jgi:hypothetical protein